MESGRDLIEDSFPTSPGATEETQRKSLGSSLQMSVLQSVFILACTEQVELTLARNLYVF